MEHKGLSASQAEREPISAKQNAATMKRLIDGWHLGPLKASEDPKDNVDYWSSLARIWGLTEAEARRQLCANCEYFENTPEQMERMDAVPFNDTDADGGGRGYCHKFDFICHNLRTCQAWERKAYMLVD